MLNNVKNEKGISLVEIILASTVFVMLATAIIGAIIYSQQTVVGSGVRARAIYLAEEGIEAVESIKDDAWNEVRFSQSGIDITGDQWNLSGEGTSETIEIFTRTTVFTDVCRDASDDIATCPASYTDIHTKKVTVTVSWEDAFIGTKTVEKETYISNWRSANWVQTDWSGGDGQSIWSDTTMYYSDNGNIDYSTLGELKLKNLGGGVNICEGYTWPFDSGGNYSYDSGKIEVTTGYAQLISGSGSITGQTTDPGFDTGTPWSSGTWDDGGGEFAINNRQSSGGNPSWWAQTRLWARKNREVGGYWEQAFTTTTDNPDSVTIDLDHIVTTYSVTSGTTAYFYAFVETTSGEPSAIGNAIWSQQITGTISWTSATTIDATSEVTTAGTYYLKIAMWIDVPNSGNNSYRYVDGGFDNVELNWSKTTSGYPTDSPTVNPITSYEPTTIDSWTSFSETANKNGGEIYYQLSDDDGNTWYYWNGSLWATAGATDYNTATTVNDNITSFPTANKKFMFKAFLESDGAQFVQLDEISVGCANIQLEAGTISTDENWTSVSLSNTYTSPIVVTSYYEDNNSNAASVRIQNLDSDSFEARLQNPSGSDLQSDEITYLVIEEGTWTIDGIQIEAHKYDTNTVGYKSNWNNFDTQNYTHTYSSDPIVLHQVITSNDNNWITTYVRSLSSSNSPPDTSGLGVGLNGAEAVNSHGTETIGWIAAERDQTGTVDTTNFETYRTSDTVRGHDNGCYSFNYQNSYSSAPLVLGFQEEMDGGDGGWSVTCNNTASEASFHAEEDQVSDSERGHTTETYSYIAFNQAFSYTSATSEGQIKDDTQAEFNQGTYSNTQWNTNHVELTATGRTNGSGSYSSKIFNITSSVSWDTLSWIPSAPYEKALPDDGEAESVYSQGNIDMTQNEVLFHLDEASGSTSFSDSSGNSYNSSCAGSACPISGSSGNINSGLTFDGNEDYLTASTDLNQWLGGTASVSYWINTTQTGDSTFWSSPGIVGIESSGDGNDIFWGWIDNNGYLGFNVGDAGGIKSSSPINDDEWHHIFMTRNSSTGLIQLYVDGNLSNQGTFDTGSKTNSFYSIGRIEDTGGSPEYYQGSLDEFVVWNTVQDSTFASNIYQRGALKLKFQLRSCDDSNCNTEQFIGPDGTNSTYYTEANSTELSLPSFVITNLSDNQYFQYKVDFLTLDSAITPELEEVTITYAGSGGEGYETDGVLTSSAYDTGQASSIQIIEWDEVIPSCTPSCSVQLQLRAAPDSGGSPGTWTDWYGESGIGTHFTNSSGTLIPIDLNGNQWVQYRILFTGDGNDTPVLQEIRINYN